MSLSGHNGLSVNWDLLWNRVDVSTRRWDIFQPDSEHNNYNNTCVIFMCECIYLGYIMSLKTSTHQTNSIFHGLKIIFLKIHIESCSKIPKCTNKNVSVHTNKENKEQTFQSIFNAKSLNISRQHLYMSRHQNDYLNQLGSLLVIQWLVNYQLPPTWVE